MVTYAAVPAIGPSWMGTRPSLRYTQDTTQGIVYRCLHIHNMYIYHHRSSVVVGSRVEGRSVARTKVQVSSR